MYQCNIRACLILGTWAHPWLTNSQFCSKYSQHVAHSACTTRRILFLLRTQGRSVIKSDAGWFTSCKDTLYFKNTCNWFVCVYSMLASSAESWWTASNGKRAFFGKELGTWRVQETSCRLCLSISCAAFLQALLNYDNNVSKADNGHKKRLWNLHSWYAWTNAQIGLSGRYRLLLLPQCTLSW